MQNQGQFTDPAIRYAYKGNGLNIGMTDQGMKYQFYKHLWRPSVWCLTGERPDSRSSRPGPPLLLPSAS